MQSQTFWRASRIPDYLSDFNNPLTFIATQEPQKLMINIYIGCTIFKFKVNHSEVILQLYTYYFSHLSLSWAMKV